MDWVLDEELGQGGMGVVWRARPRTGGEAVALKLVRDDVDVDADAFLHEAAAVARLHHPTIVSVYDFGRHERPWIAMELLPGGSLADHPPRDWAGVHDLCRTLLDALAHAHARGLVHRDLKQQNVLRDATGHWRLVDFGVAQAVGASAVRAGTLPFMAPEQLLGLGAEIGPWTDLYALGVLVWQLVTGTLPRVGSPSEILALAQQATLPPLVPRYAVPDGLGTWLEALLAPSVDARYQTAADALWGLKQLDGVEAEVVAPWAPLQGSATVTLEDLDAGALGLPPEAVQHAPLPPIPRRLRDTTLVPVVPTNLGLGLIAARQRPLIGRIAERERLWDALVQVHDDARPRHVRIAGPPGSGRSRLLSWLGQRAEELGAAISLHLEASPHEVVAGRLLRLPAPPDRVAQRLARLLDPQDLHDGVAGTPRATAALIAAASRQRPVVLLLDDVRDAHPARAIVEQVLARPDARVLVVSVHAALDGREGVALDWLADGTIHRLLTVTIGLHPMLADEVAREAAGSPRYAMDRVTRWARRGELEATAEGLVRRATGGLVASRDEASPDAPALEIAACAGSAVMLAQWREACAEVGIAPEVPAGRTDLIVTDDELRFPNSDARDRLLARAGTEGRLERWHRAWAGVLTDPLGQAEHLVAAGDLAEGVALMESAARQLTTTGLHRVRGVRAYQRAASLKRALGRDAREVAETLGWEAWARFQLGDLEGAETLAREVAAVAEAHDDPALEASAAHTLAVVARLRGEEMLDQLRRAHAAYVRAEDGNAESVEELIFIETLLPEQRVALYEQRVRDEPGEGWELFLLRSLIASGRYDDAVTLGSSLDERLASHQYAELHVLIGQMRAVSHAGAGDLDAAETEIQAILPRLGEERSFARLLYETLLGAITAERGDLQQGRRILHSVLERGGNDLRVSYVLAVRLLLAAHAGEPGAFDEALRTGMPAARRQDLFASIGWLLQRTAAAWRRRGDEARARRAEALRLQWGGWT